MSVTNEYLETQVLTASPHQLHLMVVDGAIRFSRQGLAALEDQNWEAVGRTLARARSCVSELTGGIKADTAPELARQTQSLFLHVYRSLALAEIERNVAHIEHALQLLKSYRDTWTELGRQLQGTTLPEAAAKPVPRSVPPEPHLAVGRSWVT